MRCHCLNDGCNVQDGVLSELHDLGLRWQKWTIIWAYDGESQVLPEVVLNWRKCFRSPDPLLRLILLRKLPRVHGVRVHSFAHAAHVVGCMVRGGPIRCMVLWYPLRQPTP